MEHELDHLPSPGDYIVLVGKDGPRPSICLDYNAAKMEAAMLDLATGDVLILTLIATVDLPSSPDMVN